MQTKKVLKEPLLPPRGITLQVMAPWGTKETAFVFDVVDIIDGPCQYAMVAKPKGNFNVRCSVFKVKK